MPSQDVHDFWSGLMKDWQKSVQGVLPEIQIVGAKVGNAFQAYQRGNDPDPNSQLMLRLYPSDIDVGDRVLVVKSNDGGKYILGKFFELDDSEPADFDPTSIWVPILKSDVDVFSASTSSTSVYTTKTSLNLTIPTPGTWTIEAFAFASGTHSASGNADIRLSVDGTLFTTTRALTSTSSTRSLAAIRGIAGGLTAGSKSILFQFKANATGTVTLFDGILFVFAYRTA
jgi:hypothetical protein